MCFFFSGFVQISEGASNSSPTEPVIDRGPEDKLSKRIEMPPMTKHCSCTWLWLGDAKWEMRSICREFGGGRGLFTQTWPTLETQLWHTQSFCLEWVDFILTRTEGRALKSFRGLCFAVWATYKGEAWFVWKTLLAEFFKENPAGLFLFCFM